VPNAAQAAQAHQAVLVTESPEFKALEGQIMIEWLPRK
jgi:hypothetical protein